MRKCWVVINVCIYGVYLTYIYIYVCQYYHLVPLVLVVMKRLDKGDTLRKKKKKKKKSDHSSTTTFISPWRRELLAAAAPLSLAEFFASRDESDVIKG